ncbi:MAG TPA: glycosyltransferase family 1 protein [Turneriella sp.]|nr:glycosyltransferase family 1 protein [Turneriella sp.]
MRIAFDAKRAFHNQTGLGHYSRSLIQAVATHFPQHEYFLCNPKPSALFPLRENNLHEVLPTTFWAKKFSSLWRSGGIKKDLARLKIDLYHGLSHEIPRGIHKTNIKSVVTIHDLIHERYPEQYSAIDVRVYRHKFRYACANADAIIAISEQTKRDIIDFYNIPEKKIRVCYQSCNPIFEKNVSTKEKERVRRMYSLPPKYFLYVGSIIERKNLLNVLKALYLLKNKTSTPLVVIGNGKKYKNEVKNYLRENQLINRVIFLSENKAASTPEFISSAVFPALYQMATAMVYPSSFEGFGIPVLEALWSRLPVITSNTSCLPEAGGPSSYYITPTSPQEIATAMERIENDILLAKKMADAGLKYAANFTSAKSAAAVMQVYEDSI